MTIRWHLLPLLCLLAGCSAYVFTDQLVGLQDHPPKAVVILGSRTNLPTAEMDAFHREMRTALQQCGLVAEVVSPDPDPLSLEPDKEPAQLAALRRRINPDLVVTYRETSSTQGGANFDGFVFDARGTTLWRGGFFMPRRDWMTPNGGPALDVVNHLARDGLLGGCKPANP